MLKKMLLSFLILLSLSAKAETYQVIYHVVESGDSLSKLSQKFKISIRELKEGNNLNSSSIRVGETLLIKKIKLDGVANKKAEINKQSIDHAIPDPLKSYSSRQENKKLNIQSDAVINIKKENKGFINYQVKIGDTLTSIAKRHHISLNNLLDTNNINKDSILHERDVLIIPTTLKLTSSDNKNKQTPDYQAHQVQKGDSLALIAKKYQISESELMKINNLRDKDYIKIGQILKFSSIKIHGAYASYKVQQGDTIVSIARKYNISKEKLMLVNEIENEDYIRVGQTLKLPSQSAVIYSKPKIADIVNRVLYLPTY